MKKYSLRKSVSGLADIPKSISLMLMRRKWSKHADERTLDWKWRSTNYNRIAVVNLLLAKFDDPKYLEIGCDTNSLFDSVPVAHKVGVDPARGGNVRATSDAFFASNSDRFNVIFIDGLHTYDQVRRDVINAFSRLEPGGWIALHDMLPRDWMEHHVPRVSSGAWTGDVWKVAFELLNTKGIEFKILKIDNGVGVVRVLSDRPVLPDMRAELEPKQFSYYYDNLKSLPLAEWAEAQDWLRNN